MDGKKYVISIPQPQQEEILPQRSNHAYSLIPTAKPGLTFVIGLWTLFRSAAIYMLWQAIASLRDASNLLHGLFSMLPFISLCAFFFVVVIQQTWRYLTGDKNA